MANTRRHGDRSQEIKAHPNPRYADRIRLLRWRRGPTNPTYEAQVRLPGEGAWSKPFSLGTPDPAVAADNARDELAKREQLRASGLPQPARQAKAEPPLRAERTFGEAADEVLEDLRKRRAEAVARHGRSSGKVNTIDGHLSTIGNRLVPAFGEVSVADLTRAMLNAWARDQKVEARRGPDKGKMVTPGQSTIGSWNHSLQRVLDRAVEKGWIEEDDKPAISQKGFGKAQPNPSFTFADIEVMRDHMTNAWVEAGGGREWEQEKSVEVRYLLRAYVALATCTGIRPGEEMELILPRQVVFEKRPGPDGRGAVDTIRIPILPHQGKYGIERTAFVYLNDAFDVPAVLRNLLRWREGRGLGKGTPLFALPSTGKCPNFAPPFKRLLKEIEERTKASILADPKTGLERVPYSMRHYFATRAIVRGWSYERLEKVMGTSADMLRKHYDHAEVLAQAAELSGHGEPEAERLEALKRRAMSRLSRGERSAEQPAVNGDPAEWLGDDAREDFGWRIIGDGPG